MIVLDASVVISLLESRDSHHARALAVVRPLVIAGEELRCSPITLAEILVLPARERHLPAAQRALDLLGLQSIELPQDAPIQLASLRAQTRMKLPDCCVLLAALQTEAALLTFDEALAKAATQVGLRTITEQVHPLS